MAFYVSAIILLIFQSWNSTSADTKEGAGEIVPGRKDSNVVIPDMYADDLTGIIIGSKGEKARRRWRKVSNVSMSSLRLRNKISRRRNYISY